MIKKILMALICAILAGCSQIDSGESGLLIKWGKIASKPLAPGLVWYNPISSSAIKYDCRYRLAKYQMESYTKDMQQAKLEVAFNFAINPDQLVDLHTKYGKNYDVKILDPIVAGAVKNVIGNFEAADLVHDRSKATQQIVTMIQEGIKSMPVLVRDINLTNIDFSDVFEKAIEEKQVAQQAAITARNKTVQIEEEARQKLIMAKSEAEALQIKGDSLKKNAGLVLLEAIQKWDGKAPTYLVVGQSGAMSPLLQMSELKATK